MSISQYYLEQVYEQFYQVESRLILVALVPLVTHVAACSLCPLLQRQLEDTVESLEALLPWNVKAVFES